MKIRNTKSELYFKRFLGARKLFLALFTKEFFNPEVFWTRDQARIVDPEQLLFVGSWYIR
jgi:hypothetical protein